MHYGRENLGQNKIWKGIIGNLISSKLVFKFRVANDGANFHLNTTCLAARRVAKFRDVTPTSAKVIGGNTLNFKPNFTCSPLNFLGGSLFPLASLDQFLARVKI